jgi:hypothetical protein
MKRCANCGQENDEWRPFCTRCGASYAGPAAEPVLAPPPPGAPAPPPVPALPGELGTPSAAPGSGSRRPSSTVIAIAAVVAVAVAVGAFVGLGALGSDDHGRASAPTTTFPAVWDGRVTDLVVFDSDERSLDYKHPVQVVFLSKAAFKKRLTTDDSKLTKKDRAEIQHVLEALRAMGMVEGKVDLFAKMNQLSSSTYLAFYDPKKKQVVIPGSTITVEQRVTLAHELTHALDDQYFDIQKLDKIGEKHDTDAVDALVEGDARWVEDQYIAKLSDADRRAFTKAQQSQVDAADLKGVPKVFEVLQQWTYDFGSSFIAILHKEGGQSRINEAFRSPPIDQEQVIDPLTYLDGDEPGAISAPALPKGAKKLDSSKEFGALMWYLVLSEHINPHVALKAALGWGADSFTEATEGAKTCIEVHYRGETRTDNSEMLTALHQWIAALPKGMASVKANSDDTLSLHSCDPGEAAKVVTDSSVGAYQLLLFRGQMIEAFVKQDLAPRLATCAADGVMDQTTLADLKSPSGPPVLSNVAAMRQIGTSCALKLQAGAPRDKIDSR